MSLLLAISGGTPTADVQGAVQLDGVTVAGTLWGVARVSGAVTLGDVTVAGVMGQPSAPWRARGTARGGWRRGRR